MEDIREILGRSIRRLLRPLVKILLREGMTYGEFAELAKWVFVDVAGRDFTLPRRKQSTSRISVITGLTRKEVARLREAPAPEEDRLQAKYNRLARVISGWRRDPQFLGTDGRPAVLDLADSSPSFAELVRRYSGDMTARSVLDELHRANMVDTSDGRARLLKDAYVPDAHAGEKLHILGIDTELLIDTIEHNLSTETGQPFFQRKVAYDNLPQESIPEFRKLSAEQAQALLELLDRHLAQHDRDANPASEGTGRMEAGLGIYYFEKTWTEDDQ